MSNDPLPMPGRKPPGAQPRLGRRDELFADPALRRSTRRLLSSWLSDLLSAGASAAQRELDSPGSRVLGLACLPPGLAGIDWLEMAIRKRARLQASRGATADSVAEGVVKRVLRFYRWLEPQTPRIAARIVYGYMQSEALSAAAATGREIVRALIRFEASDGLA